MPWCAAIAAPTLVFVVDVAKNRAVVELLKDQGNFQVVVPAQPQFNGALGCALEAGRVPRMPGKAMNRLSAADPLARALRGLVEVEAGFRPPAGEVCVEPLPASRQVLRFTFPAGGYTVVGKLFAAYPPQTSADVSLAREYDHYLQLPALGLGNGDGLTPRLLGRWPERSLGLLLEAVPGPDLDHLLLQACVHGDPAPLFRGLEKLARLLALFSLPAGPGPAGLPRARSGLPG